MTSPRTSYTFREGLTMMAAKAAGIDPDLAVEAGDSATAVLNPIRNAMKAKSPRALAEHVTQAQQALRSISPRQHPELVNALQAKLLALQGRGGDTEIAHVTPGEVVVPRNLQTPAVMRTLAAEALRAGIDPRRYTVGHRANSVNPRTGKPEFAIEEIVVVDRREFLPPDSYGWSGIVPGDPIGPEPGGGGGGGGATGPFIQSLITGNPEHFRAYIKTLTDKELAQLKVTANQFRAVLMSGEVMASGIVLAFGAVSFGVVGGVAAVMLGGTYVAFELFENLIEQEQVDRMPGR